MAQASNLPAHASNDNGAIRLAPRHVRRADMLRVATQLSGAISLRYVTEGVFLITTAEALGAA